MKKITFYKRIYKRHRLKKNVPNCSSVNLNICDLLRVITALFPEHQNRGISIFLSNIFESEHFPSSNKIGKLGTHSICKGTATYASHNGLIKDWISKHGRWRGEAQMVDTYIDTYQVCFFLFASLTRRLIH